MEKQLSEQFWGKDVLYIRHEACGMSRLNFLLLIEKFMCFVTVIFLTEPMSTSVQKSFKMSSVKGYKFPFAW
jgi:hypothetical protein